MRSKCTRCDSKGHTLNLHNISTFTSRSHNIGIGLSRRLHKENSTVGEMCIGTVREGTGLVNLPKKKKTKKTCKKDYWYWFTGTRNCQINKHGDTHEHKRCQIATNLLLFATCWLGFQKLGWDGGYMEAPSLNFSCSSLKVLFVSGHKRVYYSYNGYFQFKVSGFITIIL